MFRNALPEVFEAFDFADPSLVVGRREASTVAPQALFLLNHPFVLAQARRIAAAADDRDQRRRPRHVGVSIGYSAAPPTIEERRITLRFVAGCRRSGGILGAGLRRRFRLARFPIRELIARWEEFAVDAPLHRRDALKHAACGFGYLALAGLAGAAPADPLAPRPPHFPPKAKRIIFLFMQGGVSSVDSYDYKPRLARDDGAVMPFEDARAIANSGTHGTSQRVMRSPWKFTRHGQCGRWASTLFPEINQHVDDLCFIHSMHTEGVAHGPATLFLHCGAANQVRPSLGSWLLYGLGSENANLPGFVSIGPSPGNGGARNYGNAFLPAVYQGTALGKAGARRRRRRSAT